MRRVKAVVYGKKNCSLCENRKETLKKFPNLAKKKGLEIEISLDYRDVKTVEGLVSLCKDERTNSEIPIVILEDEKGTTLHIWNGPREAITTKDLVDIFGLPSSEKE